MLKPLFSTSILLIFIISCEKQAVHRINGALEALQISGDQKAYPKSNLNDANYYQQIEKYLADTQLRTRENTPDPWEAIGPHNISGRTLALAINPQNSNTIYAGSASGGLWRSNDQGKGVTWQQIPLGYPVLGVSSISFAPNDSMTMYIGTGEVYNKDGAGTGAAFRNTRGTYGIGILKTIDGGATWSKTLDWAYELQKGVHVVKVAESDPNVVYAGTTDGVYKTIDGGANWNLVLDVPLCSDLLVNPLDENDVIAGCGNFGSRGKGLYKSTDGGIAWDHNEPNDFQGKIQLDQFFGDPNLIFASIGNGFGFTDGATWLYKSIDRGLNWTLENTTDYSKWQGWFAHDVAINPFNPQQLTMIGIEIFESKDGGKTLNRTTNGGVIFGTPPIGEADGPGNFTHSDHHDVIYDPKNENTLYVANDGGVYGSFDGGANWQSLNGGYQSTQFYNGFSVFDSETTTLATGGLQDNSTVEYSGSKAWNRVIGGDGAWTALHPTDPKTRYGSAQNLNVAKTTDGSTYNFLNIPGGDQNTAFIAPYMISPSNSEFIYAGRSSCYFSPNAGQDWIAQASVGLNGDPAFSIDGSSTNEDVIYLATAPVADRPRIFISRNKGNNFTDITGDLPNQYINDIYVNRKNDSKVYITLGGFGDSQVYRTDNSGASWIDITGNLPLIPSSAIIVDPINDNILYVGNDFGVFVSEDEGLTWTSYNDGIIDAALVMDLKINSSTRELFVATHGNGALKRDLIPAEFPSLVDDFNQLKINIVENPVQHELVIQGLSFLDGPVYLQLLSVDGQRISSTVLTNEIKSRLHTIPLNTEWANGTYFLNIKNGSLQKTIPFIVLK